MDDSIRSHVRSCLAYVILEDPGAWLGESSPSALQAFLDGAEARAALAGQVVEAWRLSGPLDDPNFYLPIVARTGHPDLSIRWATALEALHYSLSDSMRELKDLVKTWFEDGRVDLERQLQPHALGADLRTSLCRLAARPGMFLGEPSSWLLHCYLAGMDRGGDWLGLPPLAGLRDVVDGIAERSLESYGSTFAAFRIYRTSPRDLLAWVGIKPE